MKTEHVLRFFTTTVMCLSITSVSHSQELKKTLEDTEVGDRWSYNDWDSAKAAAAKSKKPILALFR